MDMDRLDPACEAAAEQVGQFRQREIEKGALAARFERRGVAAAEIGLDHRPPKRAQLIARGRDAVGVAEHAAVRFEFFGIGQRHEQLVRETERQAARGLRLVRQRRCEQMFIVGDQSCRQRDDRLIGGDGAFRRFDLQPLSAVVYPVTGVSSVVRNSAPAAAMVAPRPSTMLQFTPES